MTSEPPFENSIPAEDLWWEALSAVRTEVETDTRLEAWDVLEAEWSRVRIIDRVTCGSRLDLADGSVRRVTEVVEVLETAIVVKDGNRRYLVMESSIIAARDLADRLPQENESPRSLGSWLRERVGAVVVITTRRSTIRGVLLRIGRDHLDVVDAGQVMTIGLSHIVSLELAADAIA